MEIRSQTTVFDVCSAVCKKYKLPYRESLVEQLWGINEIETDAAGTTSVEKMVPQKARILDVRHKWHERMSELQIDVTNKEMRLLLKARIFLSSHMQNLTGFSIHFYYIQVGIVIGLSLAQSFQPCVRPQAVSDVVNGKYACTSKEAVSLAAIQVQAMFGDAPVDLHDVIGYVPDLSNCVCVNLTQPLSQRCPVEVLLPESHGPAIHQ